MLTRRACLGTLIAAPMAFPHLSALAGQPRGREPEGKDRAERVAQAVAALLPAAISEFQKSVDLSAAAKDAANGYTREGRGLKDLSGVMAAFLEAERKAEVSMESKLRAYVLIAYSACASAKNVGGDTLKIALQKVCDEFKKTEGPREHFGTIIKNVVGAGPLFPPKAHLTGRADVRSSPSGLDVYVDDAYAGDTSRVFRVLAGDREFRVKKSPECRKKERVEADKLVTIDC